MRRHDEIRLRTAYATVELRPACQQPPHELMAAIAPYLGLVEGHGEISEYVQSALAPEEDRTLARRGYGEERTLTPLWQRLEQKENPVQRARRRVFAQEGVEGLINASDVGSYLR